MRSIPRPSYRRPRGQGQRLRSIAALILVLSLSVLVMSWIFTNPPGASPDEPTQYIKTVAIAHGSFMGRKLAPGETPSWEMDGWYVNPGEGHASTTPWLRRITRVVELPAKLTPPPGLTCVAFRPARSAGCIPDQPPPNDPTTQIADYTGLRQPFAFLIPASLVRLGSDPSSSIYLGRLAIALFALAFIGSGIALLWSPAAPGRSLIGPLMALSPMTLFVVSVISNSGLEIAGSFTVLAALLRLDRDERLPGWGWWAFLIAGTLVAMSRPLGPVFLAAAAMSFMILRGLRGAYVVIRRNWAAARWVILAVTVGSVANLLWQLLIIPQWSVEAAQGPPLSTAFAHIGVALRDWVGMFGWIDTSLPAWGYWVWFTPLIALLSLAVVRGTGRLRTALAWWAVVFFLVAVAVSIIFVQPFEHHRMQGRWLLGFLTALPLFAGEIFTRCGLARRRGMDRFLTLGVASVAAFLHLLALFTNARRYAVGIDGPLSFVGASGWDPPLGWEPWIAAVIIGSIGVVLAAWIGSRGVHDVAFQSGLKNPDAAAANTRRATGEPSMPDAP